MKENIVITDIGSTTTKAILFQKTNDKYKLNCIKKVPTTVEKPVEDVKIGVFQALKKIDDTLSTKILSKEADQHNLLFKDNTMYLTTSSAGGGLQILVFGLILSDSASSAKRAAFGSGGVILDVFAINDDRTAIEKMKLIKILKPDIILFSGGVDGGNIGSIIRLGELLSLAKPLPKFGHDTKIPLVYAGNNKAQNFIKTLFNKQFYLNIVPNLRPTLKKENLEPAQDKIHELFMDNVMEQAPGYSEIKHFISDEIIPTPKGVINSLKLISINLEKNIMSADLGGATTDVYSNILGKYYRTVSANLGMSYSVSNVMFETGYDNIYKWLPLNLSEHYIRNYISNKMLYPTYLPNDDFQLAIEHAVAREALRLAKEQHMKMHFNIKRIGFLDKLKEKDIDKFIETFYVEKLSQKRKFHQKDIDIIIGAGGVLSNAPNTNQALAILIDGFKPKGITEIWIDNQFISPHLGKLSDIDKDLALDLLINICYKKLALVIKPIVKKQKPDRKILKISIKSKKESKTINVSGNDFIFIKNEEGINKELNIEPEKGCYIESDEKIISLETRLPIIIDTRYNNPKVKKVNEELNLYDFKQPKKELEKIFLKFIPDKEIKTGIHILEKSLPYKGKLLVKKGENVEYDTLIGENPYEPPKIYVLSLFTKKYLGLNTKTFKESLVVKKGDTIKMGQKMLDIHQKGLSNVFLGKLKNYYSPIRGFIEDININSGLIILREIQDYSTKPIKVNIAKKLNVKPNHIKGYLKKSEGDFIQAYEILAKKIDTPNDIQTIQAPSTGIITKIDKKDGSVTIKYNKKPYKLYAGIKGKVVEIKENYSAKIQYSGSILEGIIGFGKESTGKILCSNINELNKKTDSMKDKVIVNFQKINYDLLKKYAETDIAGVIIPSIDNKDLIQFIGKEIGVALTGKENIPYPIIITEGFGDFEMNEKYKKFFLKYNGNLAYLNARTQIRAGVTRPKIIIID